RDALVRHDVIRARSFGQRIVTDRAVHQLEYRFGTLGRAEAADPFAIGREETGEGAVIPVVVRGAVSEDQCADGLSILENLDPSSERRYVGGRLALLPVRTESEKCRREHR